MKRILFGLLALTLGSGFALAEGVPYKRGSIGAAEKFTWSGVYAGIGGGYSWTTAEVDIFSGGDSLNLIDSVALRGWRGDARVGADWQTGAVVFGLLGGYQIGETEGSILGGLGTATLTPTWYAGGRIGLARDKTLWYVGGAYQKAELDIGFNGKTVDSRDLDGYKLMVGVESYITPNLTLSLEGGHVWYGKEKWGDTHGISANIQDTEVMLRLNYRPMTGLFNF